MNATEEEAREDVANIHLIVNGKERQFPVRVPLGKRLPLEVLPAARELAVRIGAETAAQASDQGRTVSCRAGCGACCRQLVSISFVEAKHLAQVVESLPVERQRVIRARFAQAIKRLEESGLLDPEAVPGDRCLLGVDLGHPLVNVRHVSIAYWQQQIPCPFLEDESCSIHAQRPLVCAEYVVTSPAERCARLYEEDVKALRPPVSLGDAFVKAAHKVLGLPPHRMPLALALEWSQKHGDTVQSPRDGLAMFQTLIGELDENYDRAFDQRANEVS